jgi:acyl-CoA synthetase (AMP-forming)/AMP-acid ligase II
MLRSAAEQFGGRLAIEDGPTRFTFAELDDEAVSFGAALVATGVEPGDRVAIWTCNSVEWVVAMLGTTLAGAVLVPVNTRFKGTEAADILRRSRARVLVTATDFLETDYVEMLRSTGAALPDLATTVVARGGAPGRHRTVGRLSSAVPRTPGGSSSISDATVWDRTIRRTSSSPRGPPVCPRGWS